MPDDMLGDMMQGSLDDKFHLLDEKVGVLVGELKRLRDDNALQAEELGRLRAVSSETDGLRQENMDLRARIDVLEAQAQLSEGKEDEIRKRLRTIIGKIDALESAATDE
jgi:predicted RecB family endonuclease